MWLCTQLGFFSIVRKGNDIHVRGRRFADMENLRLAVRAISEVWLPDTQTWPGADYRYRIIFGASSPHLLSIMDTLAAKVDYANFKSRIANRPDQREKMPGYHDLWQSGVEWQYACPMKRAQDIANTSVDDASKSLPNIHDVELLTKALTLCEASGQKSKAKIIARRIKRISQL